MHGDGTSTGCAHRARIGHGLSITASRLSKVPLSGVDVSEHRQGEDIEVGSGGPACRFARFLDERAGLHRIAEMQHLATAEHGGFGDHAEGAKGAMALDGFAKEV